jgi:hypothetical protein
MRGTMIANIDPYIVLGSAFVGFLVGLTGAGGGALMTPMLILLFNVKPLTALWFVRRSQLRPVVRTVRGTLRTAQRSTKPE